MPVSYNGTQECKILFLLAHFSNYISGTWPKLDQAVVRSQVSETCKG